MASPSSGLPLGIRLGDPRHGPWWPPHGRSVEWIFGQPVEWASSRDPSRGSAAWPLVAPAWPTRRMDLWPARRVGSFSGSVWGIRGMALGGPARPIRRVDPWPARRVGFFAGSVEGDQRLGPGGPRVSVPSRGAVASPSCGPRPSARFTWRVALAAEAMSVAPPSARGRPSSHYSGPWRPRAVSLISWLPLMGLRAPNSPRARRTFSKKLASVASACSSVWPRAI